MGRRGPQANFMPSLNQAGSWFKPAFCSAVNVMFNHSTSGPEVPTPRREGFSFLARLA